MSQFWRCVSVAAVLIGGDNMGRKSNNNKVNKKLGPTTLELISGYVP